MIFNIHGKHKTKVICINIFLLFVYSYALSREKSQIIQVYSTYQSINTLTNTIIFSGQVTLKYKNINLHADKILISYTKNTYLPTTIEAYGNPATCHHAQDTNNVMLAQSSQIYYNAADSTINLIGNAYIKQSGNSIHSDNITYSIKNKQIKAVANTGKQVIMTFLMKST